MCHIFLTFILAHVSAKQKLCFSDIYSSSSDEENEIPLAQLRKKRYVPKQNDYVVVQFEGKKSRKHYIGIVHSQLEDSPQEYVIRFLRRITATNKFFYPSLDDTSVIHKNNIVTILPTPTLNNREQYIFDMNSIQFDNLN